MDICYEKQVGENIRLLRKRNKLTQDQLAAKLQVLGCDITRSALAKIEVGQRHLYPDEIKALKQILNVPYESILS
ncbi:MAG: helix-turn-helix transcriptional regulator [Clostridia bacterium]|nr:helix-turn-helix transcriptional regulator [Clostridia bacterium]